MRPQIEKARYIVSSTASRVLNWTFTERTPCSASMQHDPSFANMFSALTNKNDEIYGLAKFISKTRKCKSREEEEKLINKELGKIRCCFQKRTVDGYTKKKYVCKLLFIFLMGRNIDFGYSEALSLLSSNVYCEKQMGYLFLSILFDTNSETVNFLIKCMKSDLESENWRFIDLAVKCIANIGNKDMAQEFVPVLLGIIESTSCPGWVVQSSLLCYLKLFRAGASDLSSSHMRRILGLLSHRDLGIVQCATTLIDALIKGCREYNENEIVRMVVTELWRIFSHNRVGLKEDYAPNRCMPAPWLIISLLKVLQNFTVPKEPAVKKMLVDVLDLILMRTQDSHVMTKEVRGRYAVRHNSTSTIYLKYAVFFEAVNVITQNTDDSELWSRACPVLDRILAANIPNLRYMAFDSMSRLAVSEDCRSKIRNYQQKALYSLKNDVDVSIQHKAVNFLYSICDKNNVDTIVNELLEFLRVADFTIREAIALQVATIADHWFSDNFWYVDVLLKLISVAGDFIDEQVYSKVIQTVTVSKDIQKQACYSVFLYLKESLHCETLVRLGGFILGEFGHLIKDIESSSVEIQWKILFSKFSYSSNYTKANLLSTFMKIANKFPEMRSNAIEMFAVTAQSSDLEVQKRSVEYLKLLKLHSSQPLLSEVFREVPPLEDVVYKVFSQGSNNLSLTNLANADYGLESGDAPSTNTEQQNEAIQSPPRSYYAFSNNKQLKIRMMTEFQGHSGKVSVMYLNITQSVFPLNVQFAEYTLDDQLGLALSPLPKELEPGKKVEQTISIVCLGVFQNQPILVVSIATKEKHQQSSKLSIKIPVFINNFLQPTSMREEEFFQKWRDLEGVNFACCDDTFRPNAPSFDFKQKIWKLERFNFKVLNDVRMSSDRIIAAAIFLSASSSTGCLLMLEPDQHLLTIKSPDPSLATRVMNTLKDIL
ncbi:hypothetical protein GE061_011464 [Apolygus lucorum]|uniref:AP-2 complex subunit alpha n=1 Tax=Apolygus lucorum TaxID=248454 RepID=A0A6A4JZE9_APOLU|nr:hypothetical protein GE061_011464 [Apolygus lucorum]